jgi:hypothetical protein
MWFVPVEVVYGCLEKGVQLEKTALSLIVLILLFSSICLFSDTKVTGDPHGKNHRSAKAFITYYWSFYETIYCPGCENVGIKKPIFVNLYVPGFMSEEEIQTVMKSLAQFIENHTDYSKKALFIHSHIAEKYQLYIMGDVVTNWSQVGGPDY